MLKAVSTSLLFLLLLAWGESSHAGQGSEASGQQQANSPRNARELIQKLRDEFTGTSVVVLQQGLHAGVFAAGNLSRFDGRMSEMSTIYYRVSRERAERDRRAWESCCTPVGDGRTFRRTERNTSPVASPIGTSEERLRVIRLNLLTESVEFLLHADQVRHGPVPGTSTDRTMTPQWGLSYRFVVGEGPINSGDYETVIAEIHQVLQPAHMIESRAADAAASDDSPLRTPAQASITIGMSKEDVTSSLGPARQVVTFGNREMLQYDGFSVVLEDGKVVDVRF